jgi:ubiquitin C-terminal hydrolase
LFAVNEHRGTIEFGHYVAFVNVKGEWYCFNDISVKKDNHYKTENSLVLFYKRKNIPKQ